MTSFFRRTVFGNSPSTVGPSGYKRIVLICATLAILQGAVNMSSVIIAIPDISRDFRLSISSAVWVITILPLVITATSSSFGRLSDIYGRERVFALGAILFVVASILAGLSQDGLQLILARSLVGAAYAISWATSTALITDAFPVGERGRALAISQSGGIAGQMLGLAVGGLLTDVFSWRAVFLMTLPFSAFTALLATFYLREAQTRPIGQKLDVAGAITWTSGIALILVGLNYYTRAKWDAPQAYLAFAAAATCLVAFAFIERRVRQPVIDFSLFRNRIFASSNAAMLTNTLAISVIPLIIGTFYFRGFKHYTPLEAGLAVLPASATFVFFGPLGGWLADRFGARRPGLLAALLVGLGLVWLSFLKADSPYAEVLGAMCLAQIGAALFVGPNTSSIMNSVPGPQRAMAAGIRGTVFNAAFSLSAAVSVALLATQMPQETLNAVLEGRGSVQADQASQLFDGFRLVFLAAAGFAAAALVAIFIGDRRREPAAEADTAAPELRPAVVDSDPA